MGNSYCVLLVCFYSQWAGNITATAKATNLAGCGGISSTGGNSRQHNNIEIRRYQAGADLSTAEPWVQELYKLSEGLQPCAVVSIGDGVEIIPIEDDLLEELEGLR